MCVLCVPVHTLCTLAHTITSLWDTFLKSNKNVYRKKILGCIDIFGPSLGIVGQDFWERLSTVRLYVYEWKFGTCVQYASPLKLLTIYLI